MKIPPAMPRNPAQSAPMTAVCRAIAAPQNKIFRNALRAEHRAGAAQKLIDIPSELSAAALLLSGVDDAANAPAGTARTSPLI
jgi:hypothetical protein